MREVTQISILHFAEYEFCQDVWCASLWAGVFAKGTFRGFIIKC
jgi:hypothetical protein